MTLVVDSSVAASWAIPDEHSQAALRALALARTDRIFVPTVFWHELRNVFLVNERRGRLTSEETETGLVLVMNLRPTTDEGGDHSAVLQLARRHTLTAYDAAYLELAARGDATLATFDNKLARAAMAEKVKIISERS